MTRIIAGTAKGRRLKTPPGDATRPTSDRVREALFSALESRFGTLRGLRLIDLYAGSGAVALEALSRGAAGVVAVESDRRTAALISQNARDLGLSVDVRSAAVEKVVAERCRVPFDVAFLDPPYPLGSQDVAQVVGDLVAGDWLSPGAVVVVERSRRSVEPRWPEGIENHGVKKYGETVLWYLRRAHHEDIDDAGPEE